jgi:hypothetical protein
MPANAYQSIENAGGGQAAPVISRPVVRVGAPPTFHGVLQRDDSARETLTGEHDHILHGRHGGPLVPSEQKDEFVSKNSTDVRL